MDRGPGNPLSQQEEAFQESLDQTFSTDNSVMGNKWMQTQVINNTIVYLFILIVKFSILNVIASLVYFIYTDFFRTSNYFKRVISGVQSDEATEALLPKINDNLKML